jgi:hypothetical protein
MDLLIHCFDAREIIEINNRGFIVNPLTEQIPATTPEMLRCACEEILKVANKNFDKQAIQKAGAGIADIVCVGEKVNYNGVEFIREKTGYIPKTLIKIDVSGNHSRVLNIDIDGA